MLFQAVASESRAAAYALVALAFVLLDKGPRVVNFSTRCAINIIGAAQSF